MISLFSWRPIAYGAGLCIFLLAGAACEYRPSPAVSEEDLEHTVAVLAADSMLGRESGSAQGRETAEFIAARFKADGLAPAFGDSYLQRFTFKGGRRAGPDNRYELRPLPELRGYNAYKKPVEALVERPEPLPFSPPGRAAGELVFAGFCLRAGDWNDFAGLDVKDKIVLCLRYGPGGRENKKYAKEITFREKYLAAKGAGAAGVVFLGRAGTDTVRAADIHSNPEAGPVAIFARPEPILRALPSLRQAEAALQKGAKADALGSTLGSMEIRTDYNEREREGFNAGAYLYPPQPDDKVVIVGAHHDHIGRGYFSSMGQRGHIHNGADDNASGVAVTLEAAAALHAGPRLPAGTNALFLTFDGEERGLFGSKHFVESSAFPGARSLAMINLDMVGRLRARKGLSIQGVDTADQGWQAALEAAFRSADFPADVALKTIRGGYGPSDHTSFYNKNVPVAFVFTGGHRDYHTERDTADQINLAGMAAIARMTAAVTRELAGRENPLVFRKAQSEPTRSAFSFRVRLGVMPGNYESDAGGLEVANIRDDAPIAQSGIQKGDVIVEIDGMKIENIRDVMSFLSDASLKTKYRVVYLRGTERRETTTELMAWE